MRLKGEDGDQLKLTIAGCQIQIESGGFTSRRAVWWLIFAGVFERHPGLKLVITETPGSWFPSTAAELDAVGDFYDAKRDEPLNAGLLRQVPRHPSEYMATNVYSSTRRSCRC